MRVERVLLTGSSGFIGTVFSTKPDAISDFDHYFASGSGPVNVVAPNPVTNLEFTRWLAGALRRPAERAGFNFEYPKLDAALRAILPP